MKAVLALMSIAAGSSGGAPARADVCLEHQLSGEVGETGMSLTPICMFGSEGLSLGYAFSADYRPVWFLHVTIDSYGGGVFGTVQADHRRLEFDSKRPIVFHINDEERMRVQFPQHNPSNGFAQFSDVILMRFWPWFDGSLERVKSEAFPFDLGEPVDAP